jgi:acyl-CoA synthetase (AMP-forming)/AMP-acid ligase II
MLRNAREVHGDGADDYLVYNDERWSFDKFCAETNRMAHVLRDSLNIKKGDRVGVAMRNFPEILFLMMAIPAAGGVVVFLNGWWTTDELDYALEDSGAKLVFADKARFDRLESLVENKNLRLIAVRDAETASGENYSDLRDAMTKTDWLNTPMQTDDDFAIMYSSGTTGHPKGVVQTHRGAVSAVYSWWMTLLLGPHMVEPEVLEAKTVRQPCVLIVTPLFHVTATHPMFLLSIPYGAKVVLMYKWDAEEAVRLIDEEQVTRFLGVPTQSADLMEAAQRLGATLESLENLSSGGAKRPASQVAELQETFPHAAVASGWGMTETNAIGLGIWGPDYVAKPGAAGRLYPPLQQLRILDEDGAQLPNGEVGELTVKSAANMRCYLNKPEATAEVFQDGWLRTGDLASVDDEGYVTIVDRKKNIIIRGGENIACLDVEGALQRHPAVLEAAAFSVPHERLGEVVGVGVQLKSETTITANELSEFLSEHIAKFKIPEHYWFRHDLLPRGATDKTDRRATRDECLGTPSAD